MDAPERDRRKTRSPEPTVEQARAFITVADASSYSEAAERLGHTHVSVIHLVSRFTKALGHGRLVEQEARGKIRLTATGRLVLPAAKVFVESADELTQLRPEIRFSAYPTIAGRMAQDCPQLLEQEVPLVLKNISEANRQDGGWRMVHDVAAGRLDMAIAPAGLKRDELVEHSLYQWRLRVVLPKDPGKGRNGKVADDELQAEIERLREKKRVQPEDLVGLRIAVAPHGHKSRELLRRAFASAGIDLKVALESPNQELLKAVALGGTQSVAVMPDDAFKADEVGEAPYLFVKGSKEEFKGKYSLYVRKPEEEHGPPSDHDKAIGDAAKQLIKAFRSRKP